MKIRLIDFGLTPGHIPLRVHENDAGADVYMPYDYTIQPGEIVKIPLGFGLILPDCISSSVFPKNRKEIFPILGMGYSHISAGNIFI